MDAIIEGLLYVQGDIGLTIKDIMNILNIDEETAKREVLNLKNYYDERGLSGFDYAFRYPGMNKVLQAAGRVIRTSEDRGVILLLDERFLQREYGALFPREWEKRSVCGLPQLREEVSRFWSDVREEL